MARAVLKRGVVGSALVLGACALGAWPVRADTIELANGRRIEGRVLDQDSRSITIQVEGGSIVLPRRQIAQVTEGIAPADEFAQRLLETPLDDPEAVDALATWARSKGLEDRANHLRELARGVRIDRRFEAAALEAMTSSDPAIYLALARWCRENGTSSEVQRLALQLADKLRPGSGDVRRALRELDADEQAHVAAERARLEQDARRAADRVRLEQEARRSSERASRTTAPGAGSPVAVPVSSEPDPEGDPSGEPTTVGGPGDPPPPPLWLRRPGPPRPRPSPTPAPTATFAPTPHR